MSGFGLDPVPGMDERVSPSATPKKRSATIGLRIVNGPKSGEVLRTNLQSAVIGRSDPPDVTADIDLTDAELGATPMISRRHARIERDTASGEWFLADLGSTNGTWVDGVRLSPALRSIALQASMRVRLANLEFETEYVED